MANRRRGHKPVSMKDLPKVFDKRTFKRLLNYFGVYKPLLVVVSVLVLISAAVTAMTSLFLKVLIDEYILPLIGVAHPDFTGLLHAILWMSAILVVGALSTLFYSWLMTIIAQRTMEHMRNDMFEKMQALPLHYFDSHEYGDVMSLYTNDVDTLRQMMSQTFTAVVSSILTVVSVFVAMISLSIWLTIVMLATVGLIVWVAKKIAMRSGPYFMQQQMSLAALDGYVEEMINGLKVVKVFNREDKVMDTMRAKNEEWRKAAHLSNAYSMSMMPLMNCFGHLQNIAVAVVGTFMAIAGLTNLSIHGTSVMTVGTIIGFMTLARNFTMPLTQLSSQVNAIVNALAGAARIFALFDEVDEIDDGAVFLVNVQEGENGALTECETCTGHWAWKTTDIYGKLHYRPLRGDLQLDHVRFGYDSAKEVLHNISVHAEPGQKVAFVGATGAGKTTIANLINRFYELNDGRILYDGIDITHIRKNDLRRSIGIVLQDVNLFTDTVMENIRYGNPTATDADCIAAAKLANADGFIQMLPQGYDTSLSGDGAGLSQGQRQLLSIARAAVSNPPVMILDEATSSIDTRTEAIVQDGMDKLMAGRTVFVIAHRLSTIQNADQVMVLDHGRIIERGNHTSLMAEKGTYYQLYTGAFELE